MTAALTFTRGFDGQVLVLRARLYEGRVLRPAEATPPPAEVP